MTDSSPVSGGVGVVVGKELSFSRWCDEDAGIEVPGSPATAVREGSGDSESPLLRNDSSGDAHEQRETKGSDPRSLNLNASFSVYINEEEVQSRAVPFDVENGGSGAAHSGESRGTLEPLDGGHVSNPIPSALVLKALFFILVWYTFSLCLTLYNKTLLGEKLGKFPAPLLMNTIHFAMQAVLSRVILFFQVPKSEKVVMMSWKDYFLRVVPTALGTALDINLSNASLVFISVTFATMCKSASPIFLLLFAFAFRLERPSIELFGIISVISIGVLLTVAKETEFELWGFIFVMLAAVMSGFRWSMTQILLQKDAYGLNNPIALMSYVTPVMAVITLIFSLIFDPWHELNSNTYFNNSWHIFRSSLLLLLGGMLAFFMVLAEYILVSATSAVTVTIAGVVKEVVTILVAVFYFHDQFTLLKGIGLFAIIIGVSLFNWYKYQKLLKGQSTSESAKYVILDELDSDNDDK